MTYHKTPAKTAGDENTINMIKNAKNRVEDDKFLLTFTRYKTHLGSRKNGEGE